MLKFLLRCLLRMLYRVRVSGMEHYNNAGERVLIVANHTSLLDGLLLYAWLPETPTFAINTQIASRALFRPFLRFVDLFVMDPTSPLSVKSMVRFIRGNRKAVIFPEGRITVTGIPMKVYEGPGLVADKADARILPIAIEGAQLSRFSYLRGKQDLRWFPRITLTVLPPQRLQIPEHLSGHLRRKAAGAAMHRLLIRIHYSAYDYRRTLFSAFLDAMRTHGPGRALFEDVNRQPLTYRQFLIRVLLVARLLRTASGGDSHVGLLLPNANVTPVAFMALQFLNRRPAMLNYTAGPQVLLQACRTGRLRTILTSRRFVAAGGLEATVAELGTEFDILYLEDLAAGISLRARLRALVEACFVRRLYRRLAAECSPDDAAVILFTSGSEGAPKGVLLSHSNLLSNYAQIRSLIEFSPRDILFSCLPLFHSFGLNAGCLMPMLGGSRIFFYPTPLHYRIIPELIYELGATILFGTSTFFRGYARHAHEYDFFSLRYVVAGAEKLRDETQRQWMEKFGIRILQGYGVTEASPVIAVNTPVCGRLGTVGPPLTDIEYRLEPVPGIRHGGRLLVRGPNIMLGYLLPGRDDVVLTEYDGMAGWHDTGDIAAVDDDGFITILGRAKRFAKLGGEMVSLAAVEELAQHAWPHSVHAAVSLPDERKGEKIVLVSDYPEANRRRLQELARETRCSEMLVPARVVLTEQFPVLGSGKVDYPTLRELAIREDADGSGWIRRLGELVGLEDRHRIGVAREAAGPRPNPADD